MGFYNCVTSDILNWSDALPLGAFLRIPFADDKSPIFELQVVRLDADTTQLTSSEFLWFFFYVIDMI